MKEDLYQPYTNINLDEENRAPRLGLVLLATDPTTESDFAAMFGGARLVTHATRTDYSNPLTPASLQSIETGLTRSVKLLVPGVPLDGIYFSCTSGSAVLGNQNIIRLIQNIRPDIPVLTPLTAAYHAFEALGVVKLSVLVPYTRTVAQPIIEHFINRKVEVVRVSYLDLDDDWLMARLSEETILSAAREAVSPEAEALFISCTTVRSARMAAEIEEAIGRPVVTSNQAAAWYSAQLLGLEPPAAEFGRLMKLSLPTRG